MEETFVKTPELWVNYLIREREQSDWENYVKSQEAKGEARGEAKNRTETARRMLARGLPSEQIAEFTDLSLEEIEALRTGMARN